MALPTSRGAAPSPPPRALPSAQEVSASFSIFSDLSRALSVSSATRDTFAEGGPRPWVLKHFE